MLSKTTFSINNPGGRNDEDSVNEGVRLGEEACELDGVEDSELDADSDWVDVADWLAACDVVTDDVDEVDKVCVGLEEALFVKTCDAEDDELPVNDWDSVRL